jgi:hypothetical protein
MIEWAASLRLFSPLRLELWNPEPLLSRSDQNKPQDPVDLHIHRSEDETRGDVTQVVLPADPKQMPAGSEVIFDALSAETRHGKSSGLGRLIAAVHRASRPFHKLEQTNG